jgi:predicted transposase YbfD/YdcC
MKLLKILETVKSKTYLKGRTYKVPSILALVVLGLACNQDSIKSIARFGKRLTKPQKRRIGFTDKMPSSGTIYYTLKTIDCDCLEKALLVLSGVPKSGRLIDIDGKTMRASKKQEKYAHHMLSAFIRDFRMVLGQIPLKNAGKEIPGCLELLDKLALKEDTMVCDAAFAQQEIIETIVKKESYFCVNIKGNQENLERAIQKAFDEKLKPISLYRTPIEKCHGRIEERVIEVMDMPFEYLCAWRHIKQIGRIKRLRIKKVSGEWKEENEIAYIATSLSHEQADAVRMLELNRGHWAIENKLHWVRDKIFREDEHNISEVKSCNIIANIRSFIIHVTTKLYDNIKATREMFAHNVHLAFKALAI